MARFINKAEEGYNMNMYALLPIKIVLISFTAGGGSVFYKEHRGRTKIQKYTRMFFWAIAVVEFMFIRIKFGRQICLQDLLLRIVKDT